jgi:hypothetical protein
MTEAKALRRNLDYRMGGQMAKDVRRQGKELGKKIGMIMPLDHFSKTQSNPLSRSVADLPLQLQKKKKNNYTKTEHQTTGAILDDASVSFDADQMDERAKKLEQKKPLKKILTAEKLPEIAANRRVNTFNLR